MANQNREEWLAERRTGVGASDVAQILGLSPYGGPIDVWRDKLGLREERPMNDAQAMGLLLEPAISARYIQRTGYGVHEMPEFHVFRSKTRGLPDHHICTPDAFAGPDTNSPSQWLFQKKTTHWSRAHEWGEEGTDEIPQHYLIQAHWEMHVTSRDREDIVVLIGGQDLKIHIVESDAEVRRMLIERVDEFWGRYVAPQQEPPVDSSESYENYLRYKFPVHATQVLRAGPDVDVLWRDYQHLNAQLRDAEEAIQLRKNLLIAAMGDHEGVEGNGYRINYRRSKDSPRRDWSAIGKELLKRLPKEEQAALLKAHTAIRLGSRSFRPTEVTT
jgi:putative phage-type endonuclease